MSSPPRRPDASPISNSPAPSASPEAILKSVREALVEVVGETWIAELTLDLDTTFSEDLELESIELVALSEGLQQRFGASVDFVDWISSLELDAILALSVGDVVKHISEKMAALTPSPQHPKV